MHGFATKATPPSTDKRWKIVEGTMRKHGYAPYALIEVLHTAQETFGYLTDEALQFVSEALKVPYSKVYGVATFYNYFTMKPAGEHTCVVCTGTACYINGAPLLLKAIEEVANIKSGETTKNGKVSLLSARCLGACGLAPVAVFDNEVAGKLSAQGMKQRIEAYMTEPSQTSGAGA